MSERIRGSYDDALYKSTYTLLTYSVIRLFSSARTKLTEDAVQLCGDAAESYLYQWPG